MFFRGSEGLRGDGRGWGEDNTDLNLEKPRDRDAEWIKAFKPLNKRFEMIKDIISVVMSCDPAVKF